jgi:MEMO1 family protein
LSVECEFIGCYRRISDCWPFDRSIIFVRVAGPNALSVRQEAVAGMFYPGDPGQCRAVAEALVKVPEGQTVIPGGKGGIVPHAGWVCSGAIAGEVLGTLDGGGAKPDLIVVFGAVHTPLDLSYAALETFGFWSLPGARCEVALEINEALGRSSSNLFVADDRFHVREHAVEVEMPLVRAVWPDARLLPIEVPAIDQAPEIGRRAARVVLGKGLRPVFLASSDLTHYGPSYHFAPAGIGEAALRWARENDRRLLRLVEDFDIEQIVPEARGHQNACGAGAIAAMLAACREAGATAARVLRHANSYETLARVAPQPPIDAVGYAAVVVA